VAVVALLFALACAAPAAGSGVYVTNLDSDNVSQYDVDAGGALKAKATPTVAAGDGPVGIAVRPTPPNSPPVAVDDAYTTNEDTPLSVAAPGVLGNDTDTDGDTLTASVVSDPSHGSLTLNLDGSFSYTPAANFNGSDLFTYKSNDGQADSNVATVSLTVASVNDAPTVSVAAGGSCGGDDRSGTLNLTVADVDDPAASLTLSAASSNQTLLPDGNVTFAGTGAARTATASTVSGRTGTAVLTLTVSDGQATDTVKITVKAAGNGNDSVAGADGADLLLGQNGHDTRQRPVVRRQLQ
jgi:VCBS repeat-containing protein